MPENPQGIPRSWGKGEKYTAITCVHQNNNRGGNGRGNQGEVLALEVLLSCLGNARSRWWSVLAFLTLILDWVNRDKASCPLPLWVRHANFIQVQSNSASHCLSLWWLAVFASLHMWGLRFFVGFYIRCSINYMSFKKFEYLAHLKKSSGIWITVQVRQNHILRILSAVL